MRNWIGPGAILLGLALLAGGALVALAGSTAPLPPPRPARVSLLAVGDTGAHHPWIPPGFSGQERVGRALAESDRHAPVDALLLLGDNFYPDGLRAAKFEERLRENVVGPYCRFVALTERGRARLGGACGPHSGGPPSGPLLAVLGNHDYNLRESPRLQRERVPEYVANWSVPRRLAAVTELGEGVSLVRVDTLRLVEGADPAPVGAALRRARGPWRILAAHHPMADPGGGGLDPNVRPAMARAVAAAGVPVQLYLAGHQHNLQVLTLPPPAPPLHVVSGAGSETRPLAPTRDDRRFGLDALGFARVDLVRESKSEALCVSIYALAAPPPFASARRTARWCVDAGGRVREG